MFHTLFEYILILFDVSYKSITILRYLSCLELQAAGIFLIKKVFELIKIVCWIYSWLLNLLGFATNNINQIKPNTRDNTWY